ncbi:MAG: PEP-CTERM sorting domain-containing protein [Phycisphaerales bacterium]
MLRHWGNTFTACAIALLLPATAAFGVISEGALDDWVPSIVYDPADGSLSIDTGYGYGGPSAIYYVTVYSEYGIFNGFNASPYFTWYATEYELTTYQTEALYTGDIIGSPGFMYKNEQLSFLLNDLTFIWQDDPFGAAYYGDLVYLTQGLEGDPTGDGFVGIADLNLVLGGWNQNVTPGDTQAGDLDGDGFVGIADLNMVLGNWNAGTPPAASVVPEPTTLALLALVAGAGLSRRIKR